MSLLEKIKQKLLDRSNSYKYYKETCSHLSNYEKKYLLKIKTLESELSNKNDEIRLLNNHIDNNRELSLRYDSIINKLDVLSEESVKINGFLGNVDGKLDVLSEESVEINGFLGNVDGKLDVLSGESVKINGLSDDFLKFYEDYLVIKEKLNKFLNISTKNHVECRKYFFNGYEDLIRPYMDTDFLFNICYFNDIEFLSFSPNENRILLKSKDGIIFSTNNHFWTIMEVYGLNEYSIPQLYSFDDFVVIDIGMNRAYATLNFANYENCSAVYGFEIDKSVYDVALYNINLNPNIKHKISSFNIGLSDSDELVDLYYLDGFDGINTMIPEFANIQPNLKDNTNVKTKTVEVKKTTPIINEIISTVNSNSKIILKIDTEGAEYKIIGDLINSGLISKIDVILGEGHIYSDEDIINKLTNIGFKIVKMDKSELAYSFALVKKEYYDFWHLI